MNKETTAVICLSTVNGGMELAAVKLARLLSQDMLIHFIARENGFLEKESTIDGGVAVIKDEPILATIIQKSLDDIPTQKIDTIIKEWRLTRYHKSIDYSLVWKILIVVTILVSIMAYYQRKLKIANRELASTIEELTQKDEILSVQSKQAVMGEMISMIAHQWRQPLSTITLQISNLQVKKMMGEDVDEKTMDDTLGQISDSIIYLSETIDDFQTYFHPDKKAIEIEIHEFLQKVVNFIIPRVKPSKIALTIEHTTSINVLIYMNELMQVMLNILNNAIDAFDGLDRDEKYIKIYIKYRDERVYIYVEDNASGIPDNVLERLFEPYFSTKGKNGTGLGLYMSQMIMQKQFGGDIVVETSTKGSRFIIDIPKSII